MITEQERIDFLDKWKKVLGNYGITHIEESIHFGLERLNHSRNKPCIKIDELDHMLSEFIDTPMLREDIECIKNHTCKPRGLHKKELNYNELEFTLWYKANMIKFVFVLKQDRKQKDTAMLLPMTVIRDKKLIHKQGILIEI
jgi:hypothetical protein